jgi:hypothetical protein
MVSEEMLVQRNSLLEERKALLAEVRNLLEGSGQWIEAIDIDLLTAYAFALSHGDVASMNDISNRLQEMIAGLHEKSTELRNLLLQLKEEAQTVNIGCVEIQSLLQS